MKTAKSPSPSNSPLHTVIPKTPNAKRVVFCFGRFQPPTIGHRFLFETVKALAAQDADYFILPSAQCDAVTESSKKTCPDVKNPLTLPERIYYLKKIFPQDQHRILDIVKIAELYQQYDPPTQTKAGKIKETPKSFVTAIRAFARLGYTDITEVFAGEEYKAFERTFKPTMIKTLNNEFGEHKIQFHLHLLEREEGGPSKTRKTADPTVASVSGTQMRNAAKNCKQDLFVKGMPSPSTSFTAEDRLLLFYSLRRASGKTYETDVKECPPTYADISPKRSLKLLQKAYAVASPPPPPPPPSQAPRRRSSRSSRSTISRSDSTNSPAK